MDNESEASFLKWFEIEEILHNKDIKPTTITNALSSSDFRKILSIGIRKCFDTLPEKDPLITNIHNALKNAVLIQSTDSKNNGATTKILYYESPFDIENLHFKILQFLNFQSLMKCSRVDKNWLHKVFDARATYYLNVNEQSDAILQVRNIYSQFRLIKKLRLGVWKEKNLNLNQFLMQLSKFKKIEQFFLIGNHRTTTYGPYRYRSGRYNNCSTSTSNNYTEIRVPRKIIGNRSYGIHHDDIDHDDFSDFDNHALSLSGMHMGGSHGPPFMFYKKDHEYCNSVRDEIIKDILRNNCATIQRLSIEIGISNEKFYQCIQQASIKQFSRLTSVDIYRDENSQNSRDRELTMNIDEIICKIIKTAINLKYLSFLVGKNDFLNNKLQFKFNNKHLLDCVTILISGVPQPQTEEQLKNVARFLCSSNYCKDEGINIITKKLLIKLNAIKGKNGHGVCFFAGRFVNYLNLNSQSDGHETSNNITSCGLRYLEIKFVDKLGDEVKVNDMIESLQLLTELNKISKKNPMVQLKMNITHCIQVYKKEESNVDMYCKYVNAPSFAQFSKMFSLMQQINAYGNSNTHMNHNIVLKYLFVPSSYYDISKDTYTNTVVDSERNQMWNLVSRNVFEKLGFTKAKDLEKENEEAKGKDKENKNSLTFEECVKKFKKHKVGQYYIGNNNNYWKCFLRGMYPRRETISLGFIDDDRKDVTIDICKRAFPIKNIEFNVDKCRVDQKSLSHGSGLRENLFKYTDEGCEFYFENVFITSREQFQQILNDPQKAVLMRILENAHGKWIPPRRFNTISVFVSGKKIPPSHHPCIVCSSSAD